MKCIQHEEECDETKLIVEDSYKGPVIDYET